MPERVLPAQPDLAQYKKQAKDLVKACAQAAPDALERIRQHHPRWGAAPDIPQDSIKLADAQLIIAREHDFATWPAFSRAVQALRPSAVTARIPVDGIELAADVTGWEGATGLVLFAQASGSGRYHPNVRSFARELHRASLCTVVADLMSEEEEIGRDAALPFDLRLLGGRVAAVSAWIERQPNLHGLPLGYLGAGTAAAAAIFAAAKHPGAVHAMVSCGGRPDLAGPWIADVRVPVLFVVAARDTVARGFTNSLLAPLPNVPHRTMAVVEGADHLMDQDDARRRAAAVTRDWFRRYLVA
jgi:putative phosphoribosyl transferase